MNSETQPNIRYHGVKLKLLILEELTKSIHGKICVRSNRYQLFLKGVIRQLKSV